MSKKSDPFFTIIIPTYNVVDCIKRALDSLVIQSFQNFECLVIDNESNDGSLKILHEYRQTEINLRIYSEKDDGVYDAMNKGVFKSSGKFMYFLGADDYLISEHILKKIHSVIEMTPDMDIVYGNVNSPVLGDHYAGNFDAQKLLSKNICHQSIFFKKSIFQITGTFNLKYKVHADWDHNLKWFFNPNIKVTFIPETIGFYEGDGLSAHHKDYAFRKDYIKLVYRAAGNELNIFSITKLLIRLFFNRVTR